MYSVQGIFQHHFQCKKVRTILNKIQYILEKLQKVKLHFESRECSENYYWDRFKLLADII
jgi:hypothetical protein